MNPTKEKEQPLRSPSPVDSAKDYSILVAEDEYILGDMIQAELTERGAIVDWAQDGQQTIEAIGKQAPDLLLLDLLMPNKNGYDVL